MTHLEMCNSQIALVASVSAQGSRIRHVQLGSLELSALAVDGLTTGHPVKIFVAGNPLACSCEMDWIRNTKDLLQWNEFPAAMTHLEMCSSQIALVASVGAQGSRIRHVQLQQNRIMTLAGEQIPNSVEHLNLSDNSIQTIANGTFRSKTALMSVDLRNNQLGNLELSALVVDGLTTGHPVKIFVAGNPLACSCEMDWIRSTKEDKSLLDIVDGNQANCVHRIHNQQITLSTVDKNDLLCRYKQICEPNCICCQYGNCDCKSRCPDGCQCFHDATYTTNIVRCSLLSLADRKNFTPKDMPMYATHVHLEHMDIPVIKSHDFLGRTRLLELHFNNASLREIQPLAFNTLSSLQLLDLSENHLMRLTGDELYRTNKITTLLLNDNQLTLLGDRLNDVMPKLQTISLHNNRLQDLPLSVEQFGRQLTSVTLGSNLFRCDCSRRFRAQFWLPRNLDIVRDVQNIFCVENISRAIRENDTT
ncbi:unnamed protein product, partial [Gongylonema pulchrum]|uniref:Ig-like domain-containing protein n=1 Tax=Gongylonema pulchrum TaxID=637853 RepID=A0A183EFE5_9BILA